MTRAIGAPRGASPHRAALLPATVLLGGLAVYPTAYLVWLALCDWTPEHPRPVFVGLGHLRELLFHDAFFWRSLALTLVFTFGALALELGLGFALALALVGTPEVGWRRREPGALSTRALAVLRGALMLPMTLTPVVVGLAWRILFDPDLGLIDLALAKIGVEGPAWVADPRTALGSLVLVDVWQWTPFVVLALGAALAQLPREPYEAAALDGAGALATFRHLTLPALARPLGAVLLLRMIDAFKAFDVIFVVTEGGPGTATETLNLYAYRVLRRFDLGRAAAVGLLLLVLALGAARLVTAFLRRAERGAA